MRLLLVDDQALFREALATLLGVRDDVVVVGEAGDGEEAVRRAAELAPEVVLMDLRMPVLDGVAATRRLRAEQPDVRVIALTTFDDDEDVFAALRAGAVGYLLKDVSSARLVEAVLTAAAGGSVLEPSVAAKVVARVARLPADEPVRRAQPLVVPLSEREVDVLRLLADGRSNREIAGRAAPRRGHGEEPRHERAGQARRPRPHPGRAARPGPGPAVGRDPDHDVRHLSRGPGSRSSSASRRPVEGPAMTTSPPRPPSPPPSPPAARAALRRPLPRDGRGDVRRHGAAHAP